jgi:hypothetical protein
MAAHSGNGNGNGNGHGPLFEMGQDRVRRHTAPPVNERIDALTRARISAVSQDHDRIVERLAELDHEWDIDRALMAQFATVGGLMLGLGVSRRSRVPLGVLGAQIVFLMQHAVFGWCPPASLFRRLGFRTQQEICAERAALHAQLERGARA